MDTSSIINSLSNTFFAYLLHQKKVGLDTLLEVSQQEDQELFLELWLEKEIKIKDKFQNFLAEFNETLIEKELFTQEILEQCSVATKTDKGESNVEALEDEGETRLAPDEKETRQGETQTVYENEISPISSQQEKTDTNRYNLLEVLGAGGMGVVERVFDKVLGREVALKRIHVQERFSYKLSKTQQTMLWRLKREAEITAILEHPNIVPLYDLEKEGKDNLYFTMRKVEGKTLSDILREKKNGSAEYDENKILSIFFKVCDAVAYAHSKQVIHRDLKPDNIMVGEFGEVYVMDWGIAKQQNQQSHSEEISLDKDNLEPFKGNELKTIGGIGTPGYLPPEQRKNASLVTPESDIFALGKILRQCFVYVSPAEELRELIKYSRNQNEQNDSSQKTAFFMQQRESGIPKDIYSIIQKSTKQNREERYPDVLSLSSDIERYLKNVRVSVRDYSATETLRKWLQRNSQRVKVALVLFVVSGLFFSFFQWEKKREKQKQFFELAQEATKERLKSNLITGQEKYSRSQKIEHLLNAMNYLNLALLLNLEHPEAELKKFEIGKNLIQLCCKNEEYQLANYMAKELKGLVKIPSKEVQLLQKQIKKQESKQRREHQKRLDYWKKTLINPAMGMKEQALLEISKMHEKEILQSLLEILEEGKIYFLKAENRDNLQDEYYKTFATALGFLENPKAGEPLWDVLITMAKTFKEQKTLRDRDLSYMVVLSEAVANSKIKGKARLFHGLRFTMGMNSSFWNTTYTVSQRLLVLDELDKIEPKKVEDFADQASFFMDMHKYKEALNMVEQGLLLDKNFLHFYNLRGSIYYSLGEYQKAIDNFNHYLQFDSTKSMVYSNRGLAKARLGDFQGSVNDHTTAIQLKPDSCLSYFQRGFSYLKLNEIQKALKDVNQSISLNPNIDQPYFVQGQAYFKLKNTEEAIKSLKQAIRLNPKSPASYDVLGTCFASINVKQKALEYFTKAIEIDPNFSLAFMNRGKLKLELMDFLGALQDFNRAINLNQGDATIFFERAIARFKLGDIRGAISDVKEAEKRNYPDPTRLVMFYGDLHYTQKKYKEALENFTKVLELKPNFHLAYKNRGTLKSKLKRYKEAVHDYNKAIELAPDIAEYYRERASVYIDSNKLDKALPDLNQAIQLDDKDTKAFFLRGNFYHRFGKLELALKDYDKAIALGMRIHPLFNGRGLIMKAFKRYPEAIQDFTEAIKIEPNFELAYNNRGTAKDSMGDIEGALADYKSALLINPKNAFSYFNMGFLYRKKKQLDKAIEVYIKGINLSYHPKAAGELADLILIRAVQNYRKKNLTSVLRDLKIFKKYAPQNHPKRKQIDQMLDKVEKEIKKVK